MHAPTWPNRR